MNFKDIKKADYNPRKMSKEAKSALRASLKSFDDISGIVVNERTGNIVSGNHRWAELCSIHGKRNLTLTHLKDEWHSLDAKGTATGFIVRVVDWDESKEKAANVTANNDLLHGEFTAGLQDLLKDLSDIGDMQMDQLMVDVKLDDLKIDLGAVDEEFSYSEDELDHIVDESEETTKEIDREINRDKPVKELKAELKIVVPDDLKDEIKNDLLEFLAGQYYYGQIAIV